MGHWLEAQLDELATRIPDASRDELRELFIQALAEIEGLAGRSFGTSETFTAEINSGGYPFINVPDLQLKSWDSSQPLWPIPDQRTPGLATVAQLAQVRPMARAAPLGMALTAARSFVAWSQHQGRLSRDYLIEWLRHAHDREQRVELLRAVADPTNRIHAPIAAAMYGGWWLQITRRVVLVTSKTPDERRLLEPLFSPGTAVDALAGMEAVLIAARLTSQPVTWAMQFRIWPSVTRTADRFWRTRARAIHEFGVPVLTLDEESSAAETACQLLLLAFWHGHLTADDPSLIESIATVYPGPVKRIGRATYAPTVNAAAAMLLERLLHPGFDPWRGAASTRRYVNKLARIVVLEFLKVDRPGPRAWERLGVSERYYYKLLHRFAPKVCAHYEVGPGVRNQVETYLALRSSKGDRKRAAMTLLEGRGFSTDAARKWLQRHPVAEAQSAMPRRMRSASRQTGRQKQRTTP